jgi:outer membrane protein assembly factor BamB
MGVDRHTGRVFWSGNPSGGEMIGEATPAFSPDGGTVYVVNDSTGSGSYPNGHPLMAFNTPSGPSTFWHTGDDANPGRLSMHSPNIAPDGRIFLHSWVDRPYAGTDNGAAISVTWAAATPANQALGDVALFDHATGLRVVVAGRSGGVRCYDGLTGSELWNTNAPTIDATPTIDPANGNIYVPAGSDSAWVVGLDVNGDALWASGAASLVFQHVPGSTNPQRAQSAGCLSHDGGTYYFQTNSQAGDGALYAVDTADGSLKWSYPTGSLGWEMISSSPIVTPDGVIIVGNNNGNMYLALRDDGSGATLLDALPVLDGAGARATASLSADGLLYIPARLTWTTGNGDGAIPTFAAENVFSAVNLRADAQVMLPPPSRQRARILNHAVELRWNPIMDPAGAFGHYAIYRSTQPFSDVEGM